MLATLEMEESKHESDILAEALLLEEELGVVDLADNVSVAFIYAMSTELLTLVLLFCITEFGKPITSNTLVTPSYRRADLHSSTTFST